MTLNAIAQALLEWMRMHDVALHYTDSDQPTGYWSADWEEISRFYTEEDRIPKAVIVVPRKGGSLDRVELLLHECVHVYRYLAGVDITDVQVEEAVAYLATYLTIGLAFRGPGCEHIYASGYEWSTT